MRYSACCLSRSLHFIDRKPDCPWVLENRTTSNQSMAVHVRVIARIVAYQVEWKIPKFGQAERNVKERYDQEVKMPLIKISNRAQLPRPSLFVESPGLDLVAKSFIVDRVISSRRISLQGKAKTLSDNLLCKVSDWIVRRTNYTS